VSGAALAHVVVSGLATGCIYALVALSLVIVYNATRTLNFAQGEMLMVSAFVAWSAQRAAGLPLPLAFACGVAAGGVLAYVVERVVIRRAVSATHWDVLIITLGLSLVLRAGAGMVRTNDDLPFPSLFSNRPMSVGPISGGRRAEQVVLANSPHHRPALIGRPVLIGAAIDLAAGNRARER